MTDEPEFSTDTARRAADRDALATWVHDFLASPGSDNAELADLLAERIGVWDGPLQLPLDALHRLAGPPGSPVLVEVDDDEWRDGVDQMKDRIQDGWEPAPVIVSFQDGQLVLEDGTHRVESLRQAGAGETWAVVGFADDAERQQFTAASVVQPEPDVP